MWLLFTFIMLTFNRLESAQLPPDIKVQEYSDWSGGLNTRDDPRKLKRNQSPNMSNILIDEKEGSIVIRKGFIISGSTFSLGKVNFMITFNKEDGTKEFIVSDGSMVLTTKDFQTYTIIQTTLTTSVNLSAVQFRNKIWFTNGSDPVFAWDGTNKQILDGIGNFTPAIPKARYITNYQERLFMFNTSADGSLLNWSDAVSTDGIALAPDSARAWPSTNGLDIGQGDGEVGTGLRVYRGALQIFKERSIYSLYGTNTSSYFARKNGSKTGTISDASIVELDGSLYFLAQDGIYRYNGLFSERISDNIIEDIKLFQKDTSRIVQNVWPTFANGSFYGTTATLAGSGILQMVQSQRVINSLSNTACNTSVNLTGNTTFLGFSNYIISATTYTIDGSYFGFPLYIDDCISSGNSTDTVKMSVMNNYTGIIESTVASVGGSPGVLIARRFNFTGNVLLNGTDINNSSFSIKVEPGPNSSPGQISLSSPTLSGESSIILQPSTTGQFISDIATVSASLITGWSSFDTIQNNRGGSVSYFIRNSTSVINISTVVWQTITPGSKISVPITQNFVQWATTITSISSNVPTNVVQVVIKHIEGSGSNAKPWATSWNNRYWLSVSTDPLLNVFRIYVKSKITNPNPDAWMTFDGIPVKPFMKDAENVLYGGNISSGIIHRLDYSNDDAGSPTIAFYQTPDDSLSSYWFDKRVQELWFDIDKATGSTVQLGMSINGSPFTNISINNDGTGKFIQNIQGLTSPNFVNGNYFRWQFKQSGLDQPLTVHDFGIAYQQLGIRTKL